MGFREPALRACARDLAPGCFQAMFRETFTRRRALIPVTGFFEERSGCTEWVDCESRPIPIAPTTINRMSSCAHEIALRDDGYSAPRNRKATTPGQPTESR